MLFQFDYSKCARLILLSFLCFYIALSTRASAIVMQEQHSTEPRMENTPFYDDQHISLENCNDKKKRNRIPKLHESTELTIKLNDTPGQTSSSVSKMSILGTQNIVGFFRALQSCCNREVMAPTGGGNLHGPCCEKWIIIGDLLWKISKRIRHKSYV